MKTIGAILIAAVILAGTFAMLLILGTLALTYLRY
jgi:hypothetical protein